MAAPRIIEAGYLPNRPNGDWTKLEFEADVPLWPGSNMVQVLARESNDVQSLQTVVVLKKAARVVTGRGRGWLSLRGRGRRAVDVTGERGPVSDEWWAVLVLVLVLE